MSSRRWIAVVSSFLPAALWYGCITFLSNQPKLPGPGDQGVFDFVWFKSGHVFAYTVLLFFLFYGTVKAVKMCKVVISRHKVFLGSWLFLIFLAGIDEIHQSFVPGRHPRISDIFIDALGSGTVLFLLERYNAFLPLSLGKLKK